MFADARTVVAFGIVLQAAGFAKLLVIANYFGSGPSLDAYYLASVVPTFLAGVSGGILQSSFIPAYISAQSRGEFGLARNLGNVAFTWTAIALCAMAALLSLMQGSILPVLSKGLDDEARGALAQAFALLVWTAPINGIADAGALLLNVQGRFAAAAAAPLVNALVGTIVLVLYKGASVAALVASLFAGTVAQLVVVLVALYFAGARLRPQLLFPSGLHRLLGAVALPVLLSMIMGNMMPAFVQAIAARAGPGAISAMGYAMRLNSSLVQAVVLSVSTVLLPHFARLLADGKRAELRATLERVFAASLLFACGAVVLVAAGGSLIVHVLLERGNFNAADAHAVARVWLALTTGLLGATWGIFLARLFQAQRRVWFVFASGCISVIANVSLAYSLLPLWGVTGIALANSIAYTLVMLAFHVRTDRLLGRLLARSTAWFLGRALLANAAAFGAALWLASILGATRPLTVIYGQVILVVAANWLVAQTSPLGLSLGILRRA